MNVLVDTTVWSLGLRRRSADLSAAERGIVVELTDLIGEGRVRVLGLIRQEVLSGVRSRPQFEKLRNHFRAFRDEALSTPDYEAAAELSNHCKSKGITVSVVDALICSVAINRAWMIFTTDVDFEHHSKVISIKLHAPRK